MTGGSNGNDGNGGDNSGRGGNSGRSGYTHMYGQSQNGNNNELAKLHNASGNGWPNGANPNGNTATTIDIARIPCVLLLNGRERLADMINKDKLNVKTIGSYVVNFLIVLMVIQKVLKQLLILFKIHLWNH